MTKRDKRLQKLRQNPKNVNFESLRIVLENFGFQLARSSGSHHSFTVTIDDKTHILVVPYRKPVKSIYVKQAIRLIDRIIELQKEEADENDY